MRLSSAQYDVIVMGIDSTGSVAACHLTRRGLGALGLDQYNIPNSIGSSHGDSWLIRLTNHEDPEYTPHVQRSIPLWESLEEGYDEQLLHHTETVDASPVDSETMRRSLKACMDYDLPYKYLSAGELSEKFPGFELSQEFGAVYQPDGGFVNPTKCVQAHVELAQEHGATMYVHETVADWESMTNSVTVETDRTTYEANRAVATADVWTQLLVEELEETLMPWRVIVGGFQPENRSQFTADSLPVFSIEDEQQSYYGGPVAGTSGFKFGLVDNLEDVADPNDFGPRPTGKEHERLRIVLHGDAQRYSPEGAKSTKRLKTCMVTRTPDQDLIVDYLPSDPGVVVSAGFSGEDFKFSCLMGELLADFVTESDSVIDINLLDVDRSQTMPR